MTFLRPPRQTHAWILEPLFAAGLELEQIKDLLFRVAFDGIVGERDVRTSLSAAVADQPATVQGAWAETIDRMIVASLRGTTASRP